MLGKKLYVRKKIMHKVKVIGGGLAGAEAAYKLAQNGIKVELFDIKPNKFTPAHHSKNYAELVCSNSLKSNDVFGNAAGLLKEEMRLLGSLIIEAADNTKVPAGNALAVDREKFSEYITEKLKSHENITLINEEVVDFDFDEYTIVASGPLTTDALSNKIRSVVGGGLYFYDASAPIIDFESIDMENAFFGDRYDKGNGDHINCPMNKEQYEEFMAALISAKRAELHGFENTAVFEGCMPVEVMAARGKDTLRFGPLKPVGLTNPKTGRWAYACLQLRKEDADGTMYNMVGFQTKMKYGAQQEIFRTIPGLENAEFARLGGIHKNTFIKSPILLDEFLRLKSKPYISFAGQITGCEGYIESASVGLLSGYFAAQEVRGEHIVLPPETTAFGSMLKHLKDDTNIEDFQPMNINFGIFPDIRGEITPNGKFRKIKGMERKNAYCKRALQDVMPWIDEIKKSVDFD